MDIFMVIALAMLTASAIGNAIAAIRGFLYQRKWNNVKTQILFDTPAITEAELCAEYVKFCTQNRCLVEY